MRHKRPLARLSVRQLRARRARLVRQLPDLEFIVRGSLQNQGRRCGKPGCGCAEGELHGPYVYLSVRTGERSQMLYISAGLADAVRHHVERTGRIEEALAQISAINVELLGRGELP
jgi:transposase